MTFVIDEMAAVFTPLSELGGLEFDDFHGEGASGFGFWVLGVGTALLKGCMRNPHELKAFQLADRLALELYRLTASFPVEERYGLTQQMRRAAVSVASNIVEGCSRESQADFRRFIEIATGSAMELQYQLSLARRLAFAGSPNQETLWLEVEAISDSTCKMLTALGKSLR